MGDRPFNGRPIKALTRMLSYSLFEGRPLTTKGQWINPLVFSLFGLAKRLPALRKVVKPIFIIGTGRSGTTILGMVLSMHRHLGYLNEPKALWHAIHPQEDLIGSYTRGPARYRLTAEDADGEAIQTARRLFGAYLFASLSRRVVDKYPELIFRIPFVRAIFPDAKFLLLVRNGWDTCVSIERWSQGLGVDVGRERHDWWGANNRKWKLIVNQLVQTDEYFSSLSEEIESVSNHTDMAAVEWIISMREGLKAMEDFPNEVYLIRYEHLATRPVETLKKVLEFCELDDDRVFFDYARKILNPVPHREPFALHPAIEPLFLETMKTLSYPV